MRHVLGFLEILTLTRKNANFFALNCHRPRIQGGLPMSVDRKRAIALGAIPLSQLLITAGLPLVLGQLTAGQFRQLQNYLDAAVVDPDVKRRASGISRLSPRAQRQIDQIMRAYIPVGQLDDTVRLDLSKVLDPKALAPITDNPDEAKYLEGVRRKLEATGVWLRIAPVRVRNPDDLSQWIYDGKHFEVWLSLGARGGQIPAKGGVIDRDALLSTSIIGAGYWTWVDNGPMERAFNIQAQRISLQIEAGMALHAEMRRIRREATPGVVPMSDLLGGANFPGIHEWDSARRMHLAALRLRNNGKLWGGRCLLMIDARLVRNAMRELLTYVDKTSQGAALAAKGANVIANTAAVVVILLSAGQLAGLGVGGATAEATADAAVDDCLSEYFARNPEIAEEVAEDLKSAKFLRQPKGTIDRGWGVGRDGLRPGTGMQTWP